MHLLLRPFQCSLLLNNTCNINKDIAINITLSDSNINLYMAGTNSHPWHCMGMAQKRAFGTEGVKYTLAKSKGNLSYI